ncbi:PIN domain-containing protein [Sphingorhabdus sp. Alg239-R122]|uniref:PIN domain-containing protein n=1 Tax=Sphingorhabdus sp. Alg239-R122 TaxID=2305989 RepID=UPI0013D90FEE|nr:PIN domain-containing protein [Sphingorhabdus sp. Alg239-R122]
MEKLHVFIDTNTWLAFYAFTNDDLEQLRKLIALIKNEHLELYINQQLSDEFYRNRERKLDESIREFTKTSVPKGVPRYMRDYPDAGEYDEARANWEKLRDALVTRAKDDAEEKKLAADILFGDILAESKVAEVDDATISKAIDRRRKGNPPGKHTSLGDQIHWELLLRDVPEGTDLHVVSKDGDFESRLIRGNADQFLVDEWLDQKKGQLALHNELRPFLNSKFPSIKLAVDVEKKDAIDKLVNSESFESTHSAVEGLSLFLDDLSWEEADTILTASVNNSQIWWIGNDPDVRSLFSKLIIKFKMKLTSDRLVHLVLTLGLEGVVPIDELDDDVPF